MVVSIKTMNPTEDLIFDHFCDIFDPVFQFSNQSTYQNILIGATLDQNELFSKLHRSLTGFTLFPLSNCLEFVSLCAEQFFVSEGVIMNATHDHIVCQVDSQTLRSALKYSLAHFSITAPFNEEDVSQIYKRASVEEKGSILQKILHTLGSSENPIFPFSSELCNPIIRSIVSLLSQILGLDNDSQVT